MPSQGLTEPHPSPGRRVGLGPGEQSALSELQLLSPCLLLPDFQDSHFPATRPKAGQL